MREIKKYKLSITKKMSHGDEMYGEGNTVNNNIITLYGERW